MKKEEKIVTKTFQYGNEKESSWPSKYGEKAPGRYYWDKEKQAFAEGIPPNPNPVLDKAPYYISDDMEPYYHPHVQRYISSKSQLKMIDKASGTITTDQLLPADPSIEVKRQKEINEDRRAAIQRAIWAVDNNEAPLSEAVKERCKEENQRLGSILGMDLFNVAGRKNGKRSRIKGRGRKSKPN
jgi:hypothetical protein